MPKRRGRVGPPATVSNRLYPTWIFPHSEIKLSNEARKETATEVAFGRNATQRWYFKERGKHFLLEYHQTVCSPRIVYPHSEFKIPPQGVDSYRRMNSTWSLDDLVPTRRRRVHSSATFSHRSYSHKDLFNRSPNS